MSALGLLVVGGFSACSSSGAADSTRNARPVVVMIKGNPLGNPDSLYVPAKLRIAPGTAVEWIDKDDSDHTVTPDAPYPSWRSGSAILKTGQRYVHQFTIIGVFHYSCMVHPNMSGEVIVRRRS